MSRFRYLHKRPGVPEVYTSSAVNMETEVECVPKADKSRWTVAEESTLIDLVLGNENLLFGALAGPNKESIRRSRQKCWDDICQQLNSQFINSKKDVAGIKKKFSNIKQRTKEKIDNAKKSRKKTGGGPEAPQCTPAEEALLQVTGDRPGMVGIPEAIDTDASCCTATITDAGTSEKTSNSTMPTLTEPTQPKKRRKTIKEQIEEQTLKNVKLDNQRLEIQIKKDEQDLIKIQNENELYKTQLIYYSLKLQQEFNFVIQPDE